VPRGSGSHDGTIVAVSTPPGRGGIGVVRISGPDSFEIARSLFRPASSAAASPPSGPASILFGRFESGTGEGIDHGYLVTFDPPKTFTGEATAELWVHGSPAVVRLLVEEAVARGARPATPGEFTLRAFLNGRIDAVQAEAIRDLIEARTAFQAKVAHDQALGRISSKVNRLKERLAELVARMEASIEFSEEAEADRFLPKSGILSGLRTMRSEIRALAGTFERGRRVREGATIAIVGSTNVGKSSLFNRLLEEERAIVTPIAGTTRDLLEETLDLGGIPVALTDTAGLHEARDEADAEAVRRTRGVLEAADLLLLVLDRSRPSREDERALLRSVDASRTVVALNKSDLPCRLDRDELRDLLEPHASQQVSAKSGAGIDRLRGRLTEAVGAGAVASREQAFLTNVRHRDLLLRADEALGRFEPGARDRLQPEYLILDLREALDRLGEITGEVGVEGIYEKIFRNFCIGK
jgi:tRNA modification GTPase